MSDDFYTFEVTDIRGEKISMEVFRGKVLLIVNTASKCGFTPQFKDLEELYQEFGNQGLVVLGFPCNQFLGQEPSSEAEIITGCMVDYGVTFPMFSKINVNGKQTHPIYKYLKSKKGSFFSGFIKWNFTKFLIDRQGNIIKRYAPSASPKSLLKEIKKTL